MRGSVGKRQTGKLQVIDRDGWGFEGLAGDYGWIISADQPPFGAEEMGDMRLVLGFLNGPNNYGPRFTAVKIHEKYAIIGMPLPDADGNPVFRPRKLETTAHEFCHSFVNPVVDKYMEQLQPAGEKLYTAKAPAMKRLGYQNWQSLIYESVVRACVAS